MAKAKGDEAQFKAALKQEIGDRLHAHHTDALGPKAVKLSDVMSHVDELYPTFLKLYQTAGGLLIPQAAKPAADLFMNVLNGVKALGDQLAGTTDPVPAA